jgi:MEMO1 family protein
MTLNIREPAVAGQFYTDDPKKLKQTVAAYVSNVETESGDCESGIVPHAGYMFSGSSAGKFYGSLKKIPDTVIIIGPNHTGRGAPVAISPHSSWATPLGDIPVNRTLAEKIYQTLGSFGEMDESAHTFEHSLEVHLPFLLFLNSDVSIVPICVAFDGVAGIEAVGDAIFEATKELGLGHILVVASSDMSHFITANQAEHLDKMAISKSMALDYEGLWSVVRENSISMCGVIPAAITIYWAKKRGSSYGKLLDYTHSGLVTGDNSSVVAYASVAFYK